MTEKRIPEIIRTDLKSPDAGRRTNILQRKTDMKKSTWERKSVLYAIGKGLCHIVLRTVIPVRYYHRERVREMTSPYVMIGNHISAMDPVAIGFLIKGQPVYLATTQIDKNRLVHWLLIHLNVIFVDKSRLDMEALRQCSKAIRSGRILVIFPEGTRFHEGMMEDIKNGASLLILRNRVPVLPVYLDKKVRPFRITRAFVGNPIPAEDLWNEGVNADTCERLNERMRETYRGLIREAEETAGRKTKKQKES